jgi:conjugative relaxase-like TrwC/TraI family protein
MMSMSTALGASGAVDYFKEEYEHARGSYYTEDEKTVGQWGGQLAEEFGLNGAVSGEDFEKLCEGQDPRDGAQLVRHVKSHVRENWYGKKIKTNEHRAGFDITFSAPKSVSLAAIVGGDERIRDAHTEAVSLALREIEKYAQARLGGNKPAETTGKLLFASFQHDAARPAGESKYAAPDLHTHNFAFNLTKTEDGKIKPLQPLEIYKCQQYGKALYRAKLAESLEKLGYEIRVDKKTEAPEIVGISREYIVASSPRQREIKEAQEAIGAKSTRHIAPRNRKTKVYDRDEMKERHQEMERQFGGQAHSVVSDARFQSQMMSPLLWSEQTSRMKAQESVTFAIEKGSEREAVTDMRSLMVDALRRNYGQTTVEEISAEMQARQESGQLVNLVLDDEAKQRMTTEKTLQMESENIEKVRAGQNTQKPIAERVPEKLTTSHGMTLSESQRTAVEQIVTTRDQISGLQGKAGTGKTTTLAALREAAERAGYDVQGFAPTTRATKELSDAGIESRTLQKFIRQKDDPEAAPRLLVLDESSLASTRQVNSFLSRVRPEDRVLLVGDVRQHEGVEAGSPFAQLQRHGLATAKLDEIVRQEDPPLREVVEHFSAGNIKEAVDGLREQGRITEIADPDERLKAIAKDYCRQPESTLVISPANKERVELNRLIHQQLQKDGQVFSNNYKTKVLENRNDMTGAERTFAARYQQDDVIRYMTGSKKHGISAGEYARVLSTNDKANEITVRLDKSQRELTYNPQRLKGVTVHREAEREFSENDRIQFRAPFHSKDVANGELGMLEKIEKGQLTVKLDSGRSVSFPIDKNRHIDHGYAVTSYSSQGQTVNRVLVNADTNESDKLLNERMGYVAASRARQDARIYTNSDELLSAALARQVNKSTALEASPERYETKARSVARLIPVEQATPQQRPAFIERPAATERPPAQRAPQPIRLEPARPIAEPERLPIPTNAKRPASELSAEIVRLAYDNRLNTTGEEISLPVRLHMEKILIKASEQPPSQKQLENLVKASKDLGMSEPPRVSTGLEASSWMAHNAPDRAERLEQLTQNVESDYGRTVQQERARTVQAELRQIAQEVVGRERGREDLSVPDKPPVRTTVKEFARQVEAQHTAVNAAIEMSAEIVKLANDNRLDRTGQDIAAPVQSRMEDFYMKTAEMPPTLLQQENLVKASDDLGMTEPPKMSTSLETSVWMAQNAPDRAERLEQFTQSFETLYAKQSQQQQQARTIEPMSPSRDVGMTID